MQLVGPFSQLLTFRKVSLNGPLKEENLEIIQHAGVLMSDGKIVQVGPYDSLKKQAVTFHEINGPATALPGFIDCHTHLVWGGSRAMDFEKRNSGWDYQKILSEGGGIHDTVAKTRQASHTELIQLLHDRVDRHMKAGITTIEVKSGYGLNPREEIRLLEIIRQVNRDHVADLIPTFLGAHVCPPGTTRHDYLDTLITEVFPLLISENLAHRIDIFLEEEAFPVALAQNYLDKASRHGLDITTHAGQFSPEGVHLAVAMNARSADHLETIGDKEIQLLAHSPTTAVALPGASLGLGMPFAPARKLLDAGACLAIATDWNPGSAPMGNLLVQAAVLATHQKLTAAETLAALTVRAAQALGLPDRGVLQPGKLADMVIFPTSDYREILYQMGGLLPSETWKNGFLFSA